MTWSRRVSVGWSSYRSGRMGLRESDEDRCFCCACNEGNIDGEEHFVVQQVEDDRVHSSHYFR